MVPLIRASETEGQVHDSRCRDTAPYPPDEATCNVRMRSVLGIDDFTDDELRAIESAEVNPESKQFDGECS